jgi:hypothetical protein
VAHSSVRPGSLRPADQGSKDTSASSHRHWPTTHIVERKATSYLRSPLLEFGCGSTRRCHDFSPAVDMIRKG